MRAFAPVVLAAAVVFVACAKQVPVEEGEEETAPLGQGPLEPWETIDPGFKGCEGG
jgi:hypothetical protein